MFTSPTKLFQSITPASATPTGYQISRSLRFNSADSAYLNRTPASASNRKTWTLSGWVKKSRNGEFFTMLEANYPSTPWNVFGFDDTDKLSFDPSAGVGAGWATTAVFRDLSAWYHIVFVLDTTSATSTMNGSSTDRIRAYVNGVQFVLSGGTVPTQNSDLSINNNIAHYIGGYPIGRYNNGYMTEINFIDGQALAPTAFGETSATTGVWNPIAYTGTYGTNGFYLNFSDNSGTTATTLGKDYSGNGNNYTPNNFSVTAGAGNDSLVDSPTNYGTDTGVGGEVRGDYCTLNTLDKGSDVTALNGNLDATWVNTNGHSIRSTIAVSSGKWYWEFTNVNNLSAGVIQQQLKIVPSSGSLWPGSDGFGVGGSFAYRPDNGNKTTNSVGTAYGATFTTTDVIGCALDMDNGKIWWSKNGTWQASGDPAAGTNAAYSGLSGNFSPAWGYINAGNNTLTANFGQRPFAYTAPSGFKALVTQNLATPTVGISSTTLANNYFDVSIWTGASQTGTASITGLAFQPDFVWAKQRSGGTSHLLYDVLRGPSTSGASKALSSNATIAEGSQNDNATYGYLSAFNSNGFSYFGGSSPTYFSQNAATYVGWQWKAGGTGVTNTNGSLTSTVSANTTSGFSIVTYTIPSASATIETFGHGLNAPPSMVIFKVRNAADEWTVYNVNLTNPLNNWITLNTTAASTGGVSTFSSSSTTFGVRGTRLLSSGASGNIVAYCFAEISGFSKFGSYIGNGSSDGPFVYTGFRPRYVLIRNTDGGSWELYDTARNTYNVADLLLEPNSAGAEATAAGYVVDIVSNGFKLRGTGTGINTNGSTLIYMAFAESPFNYSRAR